MLTYYAHIFHPSGYHGAAFRPPFFEGWYNKLVSADARHAYAIIPGVYLARDPARSHAFVQVMDGRSGQSSYTRYPVEAFRASAKDYDVWIGPNHFATRGLELDIPGVARGRVETAGTHPWPVTWRAPGIMGWYAWVPMMQCYHGVISLDHPLRGQLELNGRPVRFDGGRGYMEKDWGRAFPDAWIWYQTNHFSRPGICLTASLAVIPWVGQSFIGLIAGLWLDGHLYRFATYTGARTESLSVSDDAVAWVVADRHYRLEMLARRAEGGILQAPTTLEMDRRIAETMNAAVEVRLLERHSGGRARLLFQDTGFSAGLEAVGNLWQRLLDRA